MKKTFGRKIVLFVVITLLVLSMAVGCSTVLTNNTIADDQEPNSESSITLEANKTKIIGMQGNRFTLDFVVKMKADDNPNRKWGSVNISLWSDSKDNLELDTTVFGGKAYKFGDGCEAFGDLNYFETAIDQNNREEGFVTIAISSKNNGNFISAKQDLKFTLAFKLKNDVSSGSNILFRIAKEKYNAISSSDYSNTNKDPNEIFLANDNLKVNAIAEDGTYDEATNTLTLPVIAESGETRLNGFAVKDKTASDTSKDKSWGGFLEDGKPDNTSVDYDSYATGKESTDVKLQISATAKYSAAWITFMLDGQPIGEAKRGNNAVDLTTALLHGATHKLQIVTYKANEGDKPDTNADSTTYTITITQNYAKLDGFDFESDKPIDGIKYGYENDKFDPEAARQKIIIPVGQDNGTDKHGITSFSLRPYISKNYGAYGNIILRTISGFPANCKLDGKEIQDTTLLNISVPTDLGITDYTDDKNQIFELGVGVKTSKGTLEEIVIVIETVDVNTGVKSLMINDEEQASYLMGNKNANRIDFYVTKDKKYQANISAMIAESTGAKVELLKDGVNVTNLENVEDGRYTLKVTSTAGNYKEYSIFFNKQYETPEIKEFVYSIKYENNQFSDWQHLDITTAVDKTLRIDIPGDNTNKKISFKFKVTDGTTIGLEGNLMGLAKEGWFSDDLYPGNPSKVEDIGTDSFNRDPNLYRVYSTYAEELPLGINKYTISASNFNGADPVLYYIEISKTETQYEVEKIELFANGKDLFDEEHPFNPEVKDITLKVPFSTKQLDLVVTTYGASTLVFVDDRRVYDREVKEDPVRSIHKKNAIVLGDGGSSTVLKIQARGTNGLYPDKVDTFTITIERKEADKNNLLDDIRVYLLDANKKYLRADGSAFTFGLDDATEEQKKQANLLDKRFISTVKDYDITLTHTIACKYIIIEYDKKSELEKVDIESGELTEIKDMGSILKYAINVSPEAAKDDLGRITYTITLHKTSGVPSAVAEFVTVKYITNIREGEIGFSNPQVPDLSHNDTSIYFDVVVSNGGTYRLEKSVGNNHSYIECTGRQDLEAGQTYWFKFTTIAQNGNLTDISFEIQIAVKESPNNNEGLSELNVVLANNEQVLSLEKDQLVYNYTLTHASKADVLTFHAKAAGANPQDVLIEIFAGEKSEQLGSANGELDCTTQGFEIKYGKTTTFTVQVTAYGLTIIYTINLTRDYNTAYFTNLTAEVDNDGEDSYFTNIYYHRSCKKEFKIETGAFEKLIVENGISEFFITVKNNATKVRFVITLPNEDMILKYFSDELNLANNEFEQTFNIQCGNANSEQFTITILKERPASSETIETIDEITIDEIKDFSYKNNAMDGFVVDYTTTSLNINIAFNVAEIDQPSIYILVNNITLANEDNAVNLICGVNRIIIRVESKQRDEQGYSAKVTDISFNITRRHAPVNGLIVKTKDGTEVEHGLTIKDDLNEYLFSIASDIGSLKFDLDLQDGYKLGKIDGNPDNLVNGKHTTIYVNVEDMDGNVVRTLVFNVYRENPPADFTIWYIVAGVLGGLVLILLILTIVGFVKGGGSRRKGNINDIGIGDYDLD